MYALSVTAPSRVVQDQLAFFLTIVLGAALVGCLGSVLRPGGYLLVLGALVLASCAAAGIAALRNASSRVELILHEELTLSDGSRG